MITVKELQSKLDEIINDIEDMAIADISHKTEYSEENFLDFEQQLYENNLDINHDLFDLYLQYVKNFYENGLK